MKINLFENTFKPTVINTITIEDYITYIKDGYNVDEVLQARNHPKGSNEYKKVKTNRHAVTFNFLFNKYKKNVNIISSTGLLFFDIDEVDFDINKLDMDNIFLLHKSFGGNGYSIIVKVDGVSHRSHNEFKDCYNSIAEQLGILNIYDKGALKMTQYTLFSYDPNIIVNNNAITLVPIINKRDTTTIKCKDKISNIKRDTTTIKEELTKRTKTNELVGMSLFYSNENFINVTFESVLDEYNEDCVYIAEGKPYYRVFTPFGADGKPKKIVDGDKHKVISMYTNNLLFLNPTIGSKQLSILIRNMINTHCYSVVPEGNLKSIIDYKYKELLEGNLKPYGERIKKFWVNPSVDNKLSVYNAKRRSIGIDALDAFFSDELLDIHHKVTYKFIADSIGVSEKTIKRRFNDNPDYKQALKGHNSNYVKTKSGNNNIICTSVSDTIICTSVYTELTDREKLALEQECYDALEEELNDGGWLEQQLKKRGLE